MRRSAPRPRAGTRRTRSAPGPAGTAGQAPATPGQHRQRSAARAGQGSPSVARMAGCKPDQTATHHARITRQASAMPRRGAAAKRSAAMLPRPENTSIPVSTRAKPVVRSFSQKLAFSIRKISMNRKPRPRPGNRRRPQQPGAGERSRRGASERHQQHQGRDHRRLRQHGEIDQAPTSACGRISSRFRMVPSWSSRSTA